MQPFRPRRVGVAVAQEGPILKRRHVSDLDSASDQLVLYGVDEGNGPNKSAAFAQQNGL